MDRDLSVGLLPASVSAEGLALGKRGYKRCVRQVHAQTREIVAHFRGAIFTEFVPTGNPSPTQRRRVAAYEPHRALPLTRPCQEPHGEGTDRGYRGRQGVEARCQRGQVVGGRGQDAFCADPQRCEHEDPYAEYGQQKRQAR